MNTATDINLEGDSEPKENSPDRRGRMKLVMGPSPPRTSGRFKIGVSPDIFSGPEGHIVRSLAAAESKVGSHDEKSDSSGLEVGESQSHKTVLAVGAFLLAGLVGYLIGRGRR